MSKYAIEPFVDPVEEENYSVGKGRPPLLEELVRMKSGVADPSPSELLEEMRREFCDVQNGACEEILEWLKEKGMLAGSQRDGQTYQPAQWQSSIVQILEYEFKHPALTDLFAVRYAWDIPLLDDIIGHRTPTQFADSIGVHREAVNKAVLAAQKHFKLPPRKGQRSEAAKKAMTAARLKQLNGKH